MTTAPHTTAVIVTYQSRHTIAKALDALRDSYDRGTLRCVVVDSASSDGTAAFVREAYGWVELIESPTNLGYGRGCNLGFEMVTTPFVLFMNPDAVVGTDALETLVAFMEIHPRAAIAAPALIGAQGELHSVGGLLTPWRVVRNAMRPTQLKAHIAPRSAPFSTDWICGAVMLARSVIIRRIGSFDPRFFLYFEETDLCLRVQASGYELWAVGQAVGSHTIAESARASGQEIWNESITEHFFQSRFYYLVKHHGWFAAVASELIEISFIALRVLARTAVGKETQHLRARLRAPILRLPPMENDQPRATSLRLE